MSHDGRYQKAKVILIVEDDDDFGAFLEHVLEQETPYQPKRVADGFAALKFIRDYKPDLIILDYKLPLMNGLEVYDTMRTIPGCEDIPVIFMTASQGMLRHPLGERKLVRLDKPLDLNTFLQTVEELLTSTL